MFIEISFKKIKGTGLEFAEGANANRKVLF